jgi:hypothetical protein
VAKVSAVRMARRLDSVRTDDEEWRISASSSLNLRRGFAFLVGSRAVLFVVWPPSLRRLAWESSPVAGSES